MSGWTDQQWIRLLKQQNPAAIEVLWQLLFVAAVQHCRRHGIDEDIGHDATVVAYSRIIKAGVHQFDYHARFKTYCYRIVGREIWRILARKKIPTLAWEEGMEERFADEPEPALRMGETIRNQLQSCLDRLDERARQVIEMRYFGERTPQQVADDLNIQRGHANKLAHQARQALKKCLEGQGYQSAEDLLES